MLRIIKRTGIKISILLPGIFLLIACKGKNYEWVQIKTLKNNQWARSDSIRFTYTPQKNAKKNFYIYLENTNAYPYSNIYIIAKMEEGKKILIDTLEYEMTDGRGKWLGRKVTESYENLLLYKWQYPVRDSVAYIISFEPATRNPVQIKGDDTLQGISSVGLIIE